MPGTIAERLATARQHDKKGYKISLMITSNIFSGLIVTK